MSAPLLHIGYHKTGTTYLQRHVLDAAEKGYRSVWSRRGEAIEHFVLTHPRRFDAGAVRHSFQAACAELPDGTLPVITSEGLSGKPIAGRFYGFDVAQRLHKTFPSAKVIIGIREQRSMLRSFYSQYVRQDGEWPIDVFIGRGTEPAGFRPIFRLDHLEYHLLAGYYAELFGPGNVLVLPIEMLKEDPVSYENAIHAFVGKPAMATEGHEAANTGHGAMTLAAVRPLNKLWKKSPIWAGEDFRPDLSQRLKRRFLSGLDKMIPTALQTARDKKLKDYIANRIDGYYGESNRLVCENHQLDLGSLGYAVA